MSLFTVGINHKTAPVSIRERVVFPPDHMETALYELTGTTEVPEAAILSTCNRTEIYYRLDQEADERVLHWLGHYHHLNSDELRPYLYSHAEDEAVRHTLRVACGLDSLVLGEPQILGQMKDAFQSASAAGTVGRQLGRLFQHAFSVAKTVRSSTAIGSSPVSVAFAAVSLAKQIFGDLSRLSALMIGAGETVELAARHLHANKLGRMIIANRSIDRARQVASQFGGDAITLSEIGNRLHEADIVISSTASPVPVLGKGAVESALRLRKRRPIFMVDIAVPRDIEAEVGELDDIYLYTVDDLEEVIQENLQSRREAANEAEAIIETQVMSFMGWLRAQDAVHTIRTFRERADGMKMEVLDKARQMLAHGRSGEEVAQFIAHTLTNKLLHAPCDALNRAARDGHIELLEAAHELFNLPTSLRDEDNGNGSHSPNDDTKP
ncbi:MAG: glutamyl-tRNA reductase [Chromatiales bacterium]|jgi:glutamyl-tRNA reductase|nr:glutamyl-tRNA reductase [Chromatiales bacterium]MDX9767016.1 glutamyl-tRNA reductase [Ectothiorhodospiraceae bacterium]